MATILWGLVAVVLAIANFIVDLGTKTPGGHASVMASASLGYALAPFILSGLFMIWAKDRSWAKFLKYSAILGLLGLFAGLGNVKPPPPG